jgi:hypothetical protein
MGKEIRWDNVQASQDYIIDITPNESVIENESTVKVPRWEHQRIYSYYEILNATYEQKNFYYLFRRKFLNGKYLDLQGNTNYAFVLMFDLLDTCKDIPELEKQLQLLGQHYPKTKSYANNFLIRRMNKASGKENAERIREEQEYWKLGNKFREQNISKKRIQIDNRAIAKIQQQHIESVAILNEYMKDENEENETKISPQITQIYAERNSCETLAGSVELSQIQLSALSLFDENDFSVSHSDMEAFARSNSLMKNQLVESINEFCYELLDDVLIEENDEYYTVNPCYYQKVLTKTVN